MGVRRVNVAGAKGDVLTHEQMRERVDGIYAKAVANGTHSDGPALTVCQGCRRWVDSISYVTLGHKRLCRDCDPTRV